MPKILVNYKYNKKSDTYTLFSRECVFADMPIAEMEMHADYDDILVVPINNRMTVVDKAEYMAVNKQFALAVNPDGTIREDQNGQLVWLPKNTDISKLRFVNGQLVLVSEEETQETENEKEGE